ncbi:MAG: GNAT family N-acetyltransferase, partial [Candidatus Poribacteria bacterium]|nr:GNAT family N-acetyltransferase [Candidatus Poribacteria bacterium]
MRCENGTCQILPIYASSATLSLGGLQLAVVIKEITDAEEQSAYAHLTDLHYRGQTVHGRTAKLIVRTFDPAYPLVIGFIELATPFFMNKPRSRILNENFTDGHIGWKSWDIHTLRKNIHRIVRISRTVVSPEFRGFGIGGILVEHAAEFARNRWQVAGQMPCFMEISADMLKFVPYVRQAGMRYIGETEGNLSRVEKDMQYLIERFGDGGSDTKEFEQISGILDQQIARMKKSIELMQEHKISAKQFSRRLRRLSVRSVLRDFDLFRGIVSLPKPTYLMGLTEYSQKFLNDRLNAVGPTEPSYTAPIQITPLAGSMRLTGLSITYTTQVRRTVATHAIQQAFDISPTNIRTNAIQGLTCEISPCSIVLVEGPSGSGKTTLLESMLNQDFPNTVNVEGEIELPEGFRPYSFQPLRSRKSLVELFDDTEIGHALYFLGHAGLSEPFLYLKRFEELSKGQQYRALLAQMLASTSNVWIADEFCSNLDEITANLVSDNVQRIARQYGVTLIAATSNPQPFIHSLRPDMVIRLSSTSQCSVLTGDEYIRALRITNRRSSPIQHLATKDCSLLFAASGSTTTMI